MDDANDIFSAIKGCDIGKVSRFLSASGDPSLLFLPEGISPMHIAAGSQGKHSLDIVKLLLVYGGNPNVRSFEGLTPVHISAAWGRHRILSLLLKYGGDPTVQDEDGSSAIDYARDNDQKKTLTILEEKLSSNASAMVMKKLSKSYATTEEKNQTLKSEKDFINRLSQREFRYKDDSESVCSELYMVCWDGDGTKAKLSKKLTAETIPIKRSDVLTSEMNDSIRTWYTVDEFLHVNEKENVAMIEQHWIPGDGVVSENFFCTADTRPVWCINQSVSTKSISSSVRDLNDEDLVIQLKRYDETPGPITATTRRVYLRRLMKIKHNKASTSASTSLGSTKSKTLQFSTQLTDFFNLRQDIKLWADIEDKFVGEYGNDIQKQLWRGGLNRSYFNYILLDPRCLHNLPLQASSLTMSESFLIFVKSIFYIGKGKNARSYDHLCDALKAQKNHLSRKSDKIARILDIWNADLGVVTLHCFHSSVTVEAFTREACMIEAIGLKNLTNIKRGEYYGLVKGWPSKNKCKLGIIFLYRALHIFLQEGEKQIRPFNV